MTYTMHLWAHGCGVISFGHVSCIIGQSYVERKPFNILSLVLQQQKCLNLLTDYLLMAHATPQISDLLGEFTLHQHEAPWNHSLRNLIASSNKCLVKTRVRHWINAITVVDRHLSTPQIPGMQQMGWNDLVQVVICEIQLIHSWNRYITESQNHSYVYQTHFFNVWPFGLLPLLNKVTQK